MAFDYPQEVTGIVVDRLGDWRDARVGTYPLRPLGPGEVLIKCEAAALNLQDLLMIEGKYQFRPEATPFIPGSDIAGRVVALGPGVERFSVGQGIAALVQTGAFAEYAIGRPGRCFPLPEGIDFHKAAAASSIFATVVFALTIRGQLRAGERLLVTGAAGGVGIAAVQYACQIGAEVVALVSSEAKAQAARQAGARHVVRVDRLGNPREGLRDALAVLGIEALDIVIDMVSGDVFDGAIRCIRPGGRIVIVGFASGRIAQVATNYILLKGISVVGSALKYGLQEHGPRMAQLMEQVYLDVAAGRLDPFICATYRFDEFQQAAARIAERNAVGKIVLVPGSTA